MKKLVLLFFLSAVSALGQSYSIRTVDSLALLEARKPERPDEMVLLRSINTNRPFATPRPVHHSRTSTKTVDDGCVFATWNGIGRWEAEDCKDGVIDAYWYGAIGDGITDDTAAFTAAANYIQQRGSGTLLAPLGTYKVSKIGPVAHFANISSVSISAENAVFTEADYVDSTWTSVTLTNVGTVATAVWASPHGFIPGSLFLIKDSTDVAFNGYWTVTHVDSPTQIRFNLTAYNVPIGAATALAHVSDTSHVLFRFDSCTNVNLGKIVFRGHVLPVDNQFRLGWRVVEVFRGTKGVRGELDVEGAAYGFYSGEYSVQSISGCSDLRIKVVAKSVGYPVQATGLDDSAFEIVCDTVHRGGYFGGVRRSSANIWAKNWDIVGALLSHQPDPSDSRGCEDFTLRVWDTGTTVPQKLLAYGGYRHMSSVAGYANTNAVKHKNLDIRVYGKNVPRAAGLIVQTYGTNHWVDGLKFGGNIDQSGLNSTNTGWPFFIYDTSPTTAGHYKDLVIDDFTWKSTTNAGAYPGYIRLAQAENDVEFNRYSTDIYTSQGLPAGIHTVTVPRFPDWNYTSFEAATLQKLDGGIRLNSSSTIVSMGAALGSNDFTLQWVGTIPSGNAGLFVATTGSSATSNSFGASITNNHLIVRAYGATPTDWRAVKATDWAYHNRGDIVSLGIVRTSAGLSIFTDGHTTAATEETSGTPPSWSDVLTGTSIYVGKDDSASSYSGTVYRFGIWSFDYSSGFPSLAVNWQAGQIPRGAGTIKVDPTTENGSFETLGGGGADVFANWSESTSGSSTITVSTNAINGTNSIAMAVDSSDSFAGISSGNIMTLGSFYNITFWAKVSAGGSSGQIALVGAAGGDYPISITDTWTKYTVNLSWDATSFSMKRWSLTSKTALIDDIRIKEVGSLADFDWTDSPGDRITGEFSGVLGGTSSRVISRGMSMSNDRGNNDVNLTPGFDSPIQLFATSLVGSRTATLNTNQARRGDIFRFVRKDSGSGTLTLSTTPSYSVRTNTWVDVVYSGTAWTFAAQGTLTQGINSGLDADWLDGQDGSYYLSRANHTGTQSYTTIYGLGGLATLDDAPSDGNNYGRKDGAWAIITSSGGLTNIFPSLTNILIAGANVSLAVNTTNQTITISSTGGGGGATNGTTLSVNGGAALSIANINSTTGIAAAISSTNITFSIVDRDFGDLTVSSSGTVFTIDNGVITTNKIATAFYNWIDLKPDLGDNNTWTETNTFTKPITVPTIYTISLVISNAIGVPSGGTGTNAHPAEALLVGNGTNVVKHLVASANKLAGWTGAGVATNVSAGTGIAINDGVISATGTNAPQLGVNGSSVANPNLTNGPQISPSVTGSNIVMVVNANSLDTNKVDATFYAALVKDDVGLGTNVIVNNTKIQPAKFTNNPAISGGVLWYTNANGEILAVATNLPTGGGGSSTNYVNNLPYSPLKLTNDSVSVGGIVFTTNANGDVKAQATNLPTVTNAPVTGLWQTLGSADVIVENTGTTTANVTFTNYSGIVTNITQIGNAGSNNRLQLSLAFNADVGTNYVVIFDFEGADDADPSYALVGWSQASARTATACEVSIVNNDGFVYSNDGYKIRIRIINPNATAGGSGGSSVTNMVQLSDVNISNPVAGQTLGYNGSNWVNGPISRMEASDFWIEHFTGIFGGAANEAIALDEWTSTMVSGGTKALVGTYAGRNGVWMATAAPASISSGAAIFNNGATLVPTNTMHFKASVILVLTNDLMVRAAYTDSGSSTNLPTDAFELVVTNGIIIGEACQGGFANRTQTATSFQCSSNIWYNWRVFATNSVVWFNVYTNQTQLAWSDSVTSNVPNNTQLVGVGILAVSNGSSSTNKLLIGVDTIGHGYSVQ